MGLRVPDVHDILYPLCLNSLLKLFITATHLFLNVEQRTTKTYCTNIQRNYHKKVITGLSDVTEF